MERFTFIKKVSFEHNAYQQDMSVYWDEEVNAPISLDDSYIEQNEQFTHPYTGEIIQFNLHKEF